MSRVWNESHALCVPLRTALRGMETTWLLAGPVLCHKEVDPLRFSFAAEVRSSNEWTGREVFARCARKLVDKGQFTTVGEAYESLRLLSQDRPAVGGLKEPSWTGIICGQDMTDADCKRVLSRALRAVVRSQMRVPGGDVTVQRFWDVQDHPWMKYSMSLRDRRVVHRTAQSIRTAASFADMPLEQQVSVVVATNASSLGRVRKAMEFNDGLAPISRHAMNTPPVLEDGTSTPDSAKKSRAHRRRLPFGLSMPKVLPAPRKISCVLRQAVDSPERPGHAMITLSMDGDTVAWHYIIGSASRGVRLYRRRDGTVKRLAAPYLRSVKPATSPVAVAPTAESVGGVATASLDAAATQELCSVFYITRETFLECDDGSKRDVVVGIEFDIVQSLQRQFNVRADTSGLDVSDAPVEVTLAGDGGPVRRRTMTVLTLTVSTPLLRTGRTALVPVLFLLSGEQAIHSAVGVRLQKRLKKALRATYDFPVGAAADARTVQLRLPYFLRLCGDFAMLCHMLTLTGGGDAHRCPYRWPCVPRQYMSVAAILGDEAVGTARCGRTLSQHWVLAVWVLLRWCALARGKWTASGSRLTWPCLCGQPIVMRSTSLHVMGCENPRCSQHGVPVAAVLPPIAYTPLSECFKLVRRHMAGTRGYPLLDDIPFMAQPPVLHCTGKVAKCLTWFLFALLPDNLRIAGRVNVYKVMGRSNMGGMYLREFGRLVAHIVAVPAILGVPVDGAVLVMLQLSQLITASWRRAVGSSSAVERECAAATLQLAAALLSTLFARLKPFDPQTKDAGVFNLYLHTALAHVRSTVGSAFPDNRLICDDHIEGALSGLNRFMNSRSNNASRGESLVNKEAIEAFKPIRHDDAAGRAVPEQMIFTRRVSVCSCICGLGLSVHRDVEAAASYAAKDPHLSVKRAPVLSFGLPDAIVDTPKVSASTQNTPSAEVLLHGCLERVQRHLKVCMCGSMTGRSTSAVGVKAAAAAAAAAVATPAATPAAARVAVPRNVRGSSMTAPSSTALPSAPCAARAPATVDAACAAPGSEAPAADSSALVLANEDIAPAAVDGLCGAGAGPDEDVASTAAVAAVEAFYAAGAAEDGADEPDGGAAVDGEDAEHEERRYDIVDLTGEDSDTEADTCDDAGGHADVDSPFPVPMDWEAPGAYVMQMASQADSLAAFLPRIEVVNAVFTEAPSNKDADQEGLQRIKDKLEEDVMMVDLFLERLRTPVFQVWVEKDGVIVRDVVRAAGELKWAMMSRLARMRGPVSVV